MKHKTDWADVFAFVGLIILVIMFVGEPDLHDALIAYFMSKGV